ncbi:MAG: FIST N-terminal domain-containing protein [Candidatus Omnitrophica bacterium]|nr:FIST N-terminal domain-containing protein [Candidatus Omnitrophota bacterium]
MKIEQSRWTQKEGWALPLGEALGKTAQLVLIFGATEILKQGSSIEEIRKNYPGACLCGCSTAGEIYGTTVSEDSLVATAVEFEKSRIRCSRVEIGSAADSLSVGQRLADAVEKEGLKHVFVLSEGLRINGSELVKGMEKNLPGHVKITGGLAGDGVRFKETFVVADSSPEKNTIALVGFYGDDLKIGYGSVGGWDPFGPERIITRSKGNILYELDNKSALTLYKQYLGEHAQGLPATGLLFPLSIRDEKGAFSLVRTILSVNEEDGSLTFAGDVPEGSYARLMKANFDRLIEGANRAAKDSHDIIGGKEAELAILVSCVGRKLILKQRVEEEVEGVREILGGKAVLTGFYSYGEIAPVRTDVNCALHNQTMTITVFSER